MQTLTRESRLRLGMAVLWVLASPAFAQQGNAARTDFIQKKLAAVEKFAAENQAALSRYTWTETVRFLLKDELRSTWQFSCRYGADGRVVRTALGPPPPGTTAGPFAPKPGRESKEELEATVAKVRVVAALYVPPNTQKLQEAFQAGRVRTERPIQGEALLRIADYARAGDSVLLDFRTDLRKLVRLQAASYLDDPSQAVAIDVRYATLPDGTNHPGTIEVSELRTAMRVMIEASDYRVAP